MRGFDCLISIDSQPVAAQINASLDRNTDTADITDNITMQWKESLSNLKEWRVSCNGAYAANDEALAALEDAFLNNSIVDIELKSNEISYVGKAYIVSFPIGAQYNGDVTYNISLLGSGPLQKEK